MNNKLIFDIRKWNEIKLKRTDLQCLMNSIEELCIDIAIETSRNAKERKLAKLTFKMKKLPEELVPKDVNSGEIFAFAIIAAGEFGRRSL